MRTKTSYLVIKFDQIFSLLLMNFEYTIPKQKRIVYVWMCHAMP